MKDTTKKDVQSISQMLQKGLDELFSGDKFKSFLKMTARFPNYSYRNILLLLRQCPHATKVMGFRSWMMNGRMVRSGEKALRIIAPFVKDDEREKEKDDDKKADTFRRISVFDISQTDLVPGFQDTAASVATVQIAAYPFIAGNLEGDVDGFDEILAAMRAVSPYAIQIEVITGTKKGYCNYTRRVIGVKQGLSQLHTLKTCVHEIAHALLHCGVNGTQRKEIEAESVAFIVCQYFDLDTSDYSFNYIAGYSVGKEKKELKNFLDSIQKTASFLIDSIEGEIIISELTDCICKLPIEGQGGIFRALCEDASVIFQSMVDVFLEDNKYQGKMLKRDSRAEKYMHKLVRSNLQEQLTLEFEEVVLQMTDLANVLDCLTKTQKRRLVQHVILGYTVTHIAEMESTSKQPDKSNYTEVRVMKLSAFYEHIVAGFLDGTY